MHSGKPAGTAGPSTRTIALATALVVVLLPLGLWIALFVRSMQETHAAVRLLDGYPGYLVMPGSTVEWYYSAAKPSVDQLGGPERALRKLRAYLALPERIATRRADATFVLCACGEPATGTLIGLLADGDGSVRGFAVKALAKLDGCGLAAVPALIEAARGSRGERIQMGAIRTLGQMGPRARAAVPALTEALVHEDKEVRAAAAEALAGIGRGSRAAVPALIRLLEDPDREVRRNATGALCSIGPRAKAAVPALIRGLGTDDGSDWSEIHDALASIGPAAFPALMEALDSENARLRDRAAYLLGYIHMVHPMPREAAPALLRLLSDPDDGVRASAAFALSLGPETTAAVPVLVKALEDELPEVRSTIAGMLGEIGPAASEAVPALVRLLADENIDVRRRAARAFGGIGPAAAEAVPALVKALEDKDEYVRWWSTESLGKMGRAAKEAVPALVEAIRETDPNGRSPALDALAELGPVAAGAVPALSRALSDKNINIRVAAAAALGRIGPAAREAVPSLRRALSDPRSSGYSHLRRELTLALGRIGPDASEAAGDLIPALGKPSWSWEQPENALKALVMMGPGVVPALTEALKNPKEEVRAGAAVAHWRITGEAAEVVRALSAKNWRARRHVAQLLGEFGPEAGEFVPHLQQVLQDKDSGVRVPAAKALGRIGPAAVGAAPAIEGLLRDKDEKVREAAVEVLAGFARQGYDPLPGIEKALGDKDWEVRCAALDLVGKLGWVPSEDGSGGFTIGPPPGETVPLLIRALGDEKFEVRVAALRAVGGGHPEFGIVGPSSSVSKDLVAVLVELLDNEKGEGMRGAVAGTLGDIGPAAREAVPALQRVSRDEDRYVERAAIEALDWILGNE